MKKLVALVLVFLLSAASLVGCTVLKKEKKAGLQVITHDIASSVFIDGQYLNKTPLIEKELQPGAHTIKIEPDDPQYIPYETTVQLRPGVLTVLTWRSATRPELSGGVLYEMEKISSSNRAEVSFVTIPDGAIISLEGREKEFAPLLLSDVNPGSLAYEVSLPSYETQSHTIEVAAGYRTSISIKLAKLDPTAGVQPAVNVPNSSASPTASPSGATTTPLGASVTPPTASTSATVVRILPTNFFQDGKEVLRVRNNPGPLGAEIGFVDVGTEYPFLNETINGWHKISFEAKTGWVSNEYARLE